MNLLKPSYTIEDQKEFDLVGIEKFIEKCARVCYKSESKITDDSHVKFVNNLIHLLGAPSDKVLSVKN